VAKDQVDVRYTAAKFKFVMVVDGLSGCFWGVFLWKGSEMRHHFFLAASSALPKEACAWYVCTVYCLLRNIMERTGFLWDGWLVGSDGLMEGAPFGHSSHKSEGNLTCAASANLSQQTAAEYPSNW